MTDLNQLQVFIKLNSLGWYEVRRKWNNKYLGEDCQGLSLSEVLILEGIK